MPFIFTYLGRIWCSGTQRNSRNLACIILSGTALIAAGGLSQAWSTNAVSQHAKLRKPVKQIADQRALIDTPDGKGELPVYANHAVDTAAPDVTKVLIVIHGTLRNADAYYATGRKLLAKVGNLAKGTMVVAPQFLIRPDVKAFSLSAQTLAWTQNGWKGGEAARQPAPISSFSALDALLRHFADRRLYPSLSTIVVMGHSAGAQLVQRYAVMGRETESLASAGISVRYFVANPSSYLYFDNERPALLADQSTASCPRATQWRYGLTSAPPYVSSQDPKVLEARYAARNVVYLLGEADTNPYTHFIDRSCAAMAQGPYRLARGLTYFGYMKKRHPSDLNQKVVEVPSAGHDDEAMFTSDCSVAVLFDRPIPQSCPVIAGTAKEDGAQP
ncbi:MULTISPECIES: alpha/beta hydrolase [unclassified Rhizobium]|uniref:alpha/beta hydrolase n=1 Tax=unclassified Rhizobium TaxID=2613769 RepID=UPI001FF04107|nr:MULTISPECIES: alpha/beta hydrolase [unclassified Rhizobium]